MSAFVEERLICFFAGEDAHQHFTLVVLSEMPADTTLSFVTRSHRSLPEAIDYARRDRVALALRIYLYARTTKW